MQKSRTFLVEQNNSPEFSVTLYLIISMAFFLTNSYINSTFRYMIFRRIACGIQVFISNKYCLETLEMLIMAVRIALIPTVHLIHTFQLNPMHFYSCLNTSKFLIWHWKFGLIDCYQKWLNRNERRQTRTWYRKPITCREIIDCRPFAKVKVPEG